MPATQSRPCNWSLSFFARALICGLLAAYSGPLLSVAADRDPARFEKQIAAFEQADQDHPPAPGQILFLGSSSIRLWKLPETLPGVDAINRGFGGSIIPDSVHFFPRIVLPHQPRQIVFYAGDNDIAADRSPETVRDDFKKLAVLVHQQLPKTSLIYIAIKPSIKRWHQIELIRQANNLIQAECEKDPLLIFLDIAPSMLNEKQEPRPELFAKDGLHLSPAGYEIWCRQLKPLLTPDPRSQALFSLYDHDHPWTPPSTLEEWKVESQRIRERVLVACGLWPMPEKEPLKPVIHGAVDRGDYTVERVYFASLPGHYVTGSLYRPKKTNGKIPAVLCPHGHWANGRFTDSGPEPAALQLKIGAEKFLSGARSPLQARMVELARLGCVVFHYDMIGVADNGPLEHRGGFNDADAALWLHNKLGLQTWNSMRAIDFVTSLPEVDASRIGVTGASGGGTQTFLLTAVDPRVTVAFPAVMVSTAMQGGCVCENADYLRVGINNIAIAALAAPRPLAMSGAHDWTIDIETKGYPELQQVYSLFGKKDLVLAKCFPQFQHNYNQISREMMYDWFNTHLHLEQTSPVHQTDFWPLTTEELTVFNAEHPRPKDALKEPELREYMRARDKLTFEQLLAAGPFTGKSADFHGMLAGARRVLFPPAPIEDVHAESITSSDAPGTSTEWIVSYDRARVPVTILLPNTETPKEHAVLWLDGAGKSHLKQADGKIEKSVQKLLDAGLAVASADLFLTGQDNPAKNLLLSRFEKASPGHQSSSLDKEYTGFVYGYNLTPLAERVRDIEAVVQALRDQKFRRITLVGTGAAGVWTLLARPDLPADVDHLLADLQEFTFAEVTASNDPNMVPGARKYGGLGGLSALAFPARITLHGVSQKQGDELTPLTKAYALQPQQLELTPAALRREEIVKNLAH